MNKKFDVVSQILRNAEIAPKKKSSLKTCLDASHMNN